MKDSGAAQPTLRGAEVVGNEEQQQQEEVMVTGPITF